MVGWRLFVLLHLGLTLAQPLGPFGDTSKLNDFPVEAGDRSGTSLNSSTQSNISVNLDGQCSSDEKLSIEEALRSARRLSQIVNMGPYYNASKLNCSSLCGIPVEAGNLFRTRLKNASQSDISVNLAGQCAHDSQLSIGNWEQSARRFLEMINMNDTSFECAKWNVVRRKPNEAELPEFWQDGASLVGFRIVHEPAGNRGYCNIKIDRGVVVRNSTVYSMEAVIQHDGNPMEDVLQPVRKPSVVTGSIVSLWHKRELKNNTGIQPFPVHVQQNESNGCRGTDCTAYEMMWLPSSTFGTSVPYIDNGTTQHYSIFAKLSFEQIPGIDNLMDEFRESVSRLGNVVDELSPSNIAILSLPLLIAIPPISLLERVSGLTTVWYVFGTDILAALPLLIKGIELVIVHPHRTLRRYSTLSIMGKQYGVYERWDTQCNPPVKMSEKPGSILISIALWFMIASSYCEFLFWRALQYRQGRLNAIDEIPTDLPDDEAEEVNGRKGSDSEQMSDSWYAQYRILMAAFLSLIAAFICSIVIRSTTVYIVSMIALAVFRLIGTNRFSQLFRWKFLVGVVFGFGAGPLYLIMHVKKQIRESKDWADVSDGANIGMALLGAFTTVRINLHFPFHLVFAWLYGGAITVLHAIRSSASDRIRWRYGLNGLAVGMLFGPVGLFFKRCFPEMMQYKQARTNFHGGFVFGVILLLTLVNIALWIVYYVEEGRYSSSGITPALIDPFQ